MNEDLEPVNKPNHLAVFRAQGTVLLVTHLTDFFRQLGDPDEEHKGHHEHSRSEQEARLVGKSDHARDRSVEQEEKAAQGKQGQKHRAVGEDFGRLLRLVLEQGQSHEVERQAHKGEEDQPGSEKNTANRGLSPVESIEEKQDAEEEDCENRQLCRHCDVVGDLQAPG